mgnify:CR=1 FL=1
MFSSFAEAGKDNVGIITGNKRSAPFNCHIYRFFILDTCARPRLNTAFFCIVKLCLCCHIYIAIERTEHTATVCIIKRVACDFFSMRYGEIYVLTVLFTVLISNILVEAAAEAVYYNSIRKSVVINNFKHSVADFVCAVPDIFRVLLKLDIKRYGIKVIHHYRGANEDEIHTDSLTWNDPRRVLQIPQNVVDAGYPSTDRTRPVKLQDGSSIKVPGVYQPKGNNKK